MFLEFKYGLKVHDIMFMDDFTILNLEGSCEVMIIKYSSRELKGAPHLKIVRLIGFMQNYRYEQFNLRNS